MKKNNKELIKVKKISPKVRNDGDDIARDDQKINMKKKPRKSTRTDSSLQLIDVKQLYRQELEASI